MYKAVHQRNLLEIVLSLLKATMKFSDSLDGKVLPTDDFVWHSTDVEEACLIISITTSDCRFLS